MKKSIKMMAVAAIAALSLSSCAPMGTKAGMGSLYTNVAEGEMVTANAVGSKVGTATSTNILGLVVMGDASINTAAKAAGIRKISHVDCQKSNLLGIFSSYKIVVYGE